MVPVLEAVPNFSEGCDPEWVERLVERIGTTGAEVLDSSSDPDHNRSVVTFVGHPAVVEDAAVKAAELALQRIDLRTHEGVHPRVGALDVLPFVPLHGLTLEDAVESAHRVGAALAELGLPVYFYGAAGRGDRSLADLRQGGFEAFRNGYPPGREPDLPPRGRSGPHPSAGVVCVGARRLLLAWNVFVEGVSLEDLGRLAVALREKEGGFRSLRALAFELRSRQRRQISMNLEDLETTSPFDVFRLIEERVRDLGGSVVETEVIGMIPDGLVLPAAKDRLGLFGPIDSRLLSARLAEHICTRLSSDAQALIAAIQEAGEGTPLVVRDAAGRLSETLRQRPISG